MYINPDEYEYEPSRYDLSEEFDTLVQNFDRWLNNQLNGERLSDPDAVFPSISIEDDTAMIAHAGDSRCYVIDLKGNLRYCTKDHVESSPLSLPFINRAFFSHQPEKAIPDIKTVKLQPLDRILLCTDGLYNAIDLDTLLHTLQCARDVHQVAGIFASICKERANDKYTAIIIEIG